MPSICQNMGLPHRSLRSLSSLAVYGTHRKWMLKRFLVQTLARADT
jgi:hypothetical protein